MTSLISSQTVLNETRPCEAVVLLLFSYFVSFFFSGGYCVIAMIKARHWLLTVDALRVCAPFRLTSISKSWLVRVSPDGATET